MTSIHALFVVTLPKVLLWRDPILKFNGSVSHNKKGHPTLVTQVDLILQKYWEFKIFLRIFSNSLSSCTHHHCILLFFSFLFLSYFIFYIFSGALVIPDNERERNSKNFNFLISKNLTEIPPLSFKIFRKFFKKIFCKSAQHI